MVIFKYGGLRNLRLGKSSLNNDYETLAREFFLKDLDVPLTIAVMDKLHLIAKQFEAGPSSELATTELPLLREKMQGARVSNYKG
jgi:hypothetical protein